MQGHHDPDKFSTFYRDEYGLLTLSDTVISGRLPSQWRTEIPEMWNGTDLTRSLLVG